METRTTYDILVAADALLSDESKWTQGTLYRNSDGAELYGEDSVDAFCFCGYGAIDKVCGDEREKYRSTADFLDYYSPLMELDGEDEQVRHFPSFNDAPDTTFQDVKAVFAKAIEAAKVEQEVIPTSGHTDRPKQDWDA